MDIDYNILYEKFFKLTESYNSKLDHEFFIKKFYVGYAKDSAYIFYNKNMFSKSILHHVDAKKCLIKKILKKIPANTDPNEYTIYYFDSNNKLLYSSLGIDTLRKIVTVYFDECVQIEYLVTKNSFGEEIFDILSAEINEFDDNKKIIKCEVFKNEKKSPYGTSISIEYYFYDNERLSKVENYMNYNPNFILDSIVKMYCPNRIINPEKYTYLFKNNNDDILVKKIHHYSETEERIENLSLKRKEIEKLKSNGFNCFE